MTSVFFSSDYVENIPKRVLWCVGVQYLAENHKFWVQNKKTENLEILGAHGGGIPKICQQ